MPLPESFVLVIRATVGPITWRTSEAIWPRIDAGLQVFRPPFAFVTNSRIGITYDYHHKSESPRFQHWSVPWYTIQPRKLSRRRQDG
jgi:hypothetical protein